MGRLRAARADDEPVEHVTVGAQHQLGAGLELAVAAEAVATHVTGADLDDLPEDHVTVTDGPGHVADGHVGPRVVQHARRVALAAALDVAAGLLVGHEALVRFERVGDGELRLGTGRQDDGVVERRGDRAGLAGRDDHRSGTPRDTALRHTGEGDVGVLARGLRLDDGRGDLLAAVGGVEGREPLVVAGPTVGPRQVEADLASAQLGQAGVDPELTRGLTHDRLGSVLQVAEDHGDVHVTLRTPGLGFSVEERAAEHDGRSFTGRGSVLVGGPGACGGDGAEHEASGGEHGGDQEGDESPHPVATSVIWASAGTRVYNGDHEVPPCSCF